MQLRRISIFPLFLAAAILMAGSLVFSYVVGRIAVDWSRRVTTQRQVLLQVERYVSSLKDAETGQRGYLLTGDLRYLEPYRSALLLLGAESDRLRQRAAEGELSSAAVGSLLRLGEKKLEELDRTLKIRDAQGLEATLAHVRMDIGKATMDRIRGESEGLIEDLRTGIHRSSQRAEAAVELRLVSFAGAILFNLAFIGWAYRRLSREVRAEQEAFLETARQKELVTTTLASIGDAVIVTDLQGRITFMNGEAERLTGWPTPEASGRPLHEIFLIVNEHTRGSVPNPVDKVLEQGRVVGLANHTLLVARSGAETPIDDSASPIRLAGGALFGVVLVFRDVTLHRGAEETRARLAAIVESSADAILSTSLDGVIRTWNTGAERLFGYSAKDMIGQSARVLLPPELLDSESGPVPRVQE
ncbi:MAG TPA: PAS domain-containing protein, partial [Planctomycetota bacterium]|nr:PAS domain-containing protein [Planctomycetota bacterium]